jgi:hypothetical protein
MIEREHELLRELIDLRVKNKFLRERVGYLRADIETHLMQLTAERDEAQRLLGEILSRIHNDGGQYQEEYGSAQATLDAERIVAGLRAREFATGINPCRMFP